MIRASAALARRGPAVSELERMGGTRMASFPAALVVRRTRATRWCQSRSGCDLNRKMPWGSNGAEPAPLWTGTEMRCELGALNGAVLSNSDCMR